MAQVSPDVTIARWRKYGMDRLYVALADGTKVGYWDLVTDEPHPEKPELQRMLASAYDVWATSRSPEASVAG
ncbi:MAG TPA: hypothetical protein VHR85_07685 [Nocardioides sp.]|jgi:hypothetical protein|nr:hypothetical protein [Nocardioides sp.]